MKMQRRDFLKKITIGTIGLSSATTLNPLYASKNISFKADKMYDITPTKVTKHCYYILAKDSEPSPENQAFFNNPGFIITKKGVIVIDTGSSLQIGEMVIRQIKKITKRPIIMVINTHYHGDHFLGNHAFTNYNSKIPIYSHPATVKKIKGGSGEFWLNFMQRNSNNAITGTKVKLPTKTLSGGETFDFEDVTLKIHQFGKAHTEADLVIEAIEKTGVKTVYLGDTAMRRIANMADGSFAGTIKTMQQCRNLKSDSYVLGHGAHDNVSIINDMQKFCEVIWNNSKKYYDEGLSDFEIKPKIMADPFMKKIASKWHGYDSTLGKFVNIAVQEVENSLF